MTGAGVERGSVTDAAPVVSGGVALETGGTVTGVPEPRDVDDGWAA